MRWQKTILPAVVIAAILAISPTISDYWKLFSLNLFLWIALVQSWNTFSGTTGYISLGHVVFYGIGSYVSVLLWQQVPLPITLVVVGGLAFLLAIALGSRVLKVRGPYFVILSFGLAEFVKFLLIELESKLGVPARLLFNTPSIDALFYMYLFLAVASTVLLICVKMSKFGQGLVAISEDEVAAESVGVPIARYKSLAFGISAIIPAMVGALEALRTPYFEVSTAFNPTISFTIVIMAIIGGRGSVFGPMVGAGFLVVLAEVLWSNAPRMYMIILGLLLIVFVMYFPKGITGWFKK